MSVCYLLDEGDGPEVPHAAGVDPVGGAGDADGVTVLVDHRREPAQQVHHVEGGGRGVDLQGGVPVGAAAAGAHAVGRREVAVVVPVVGGRLHVRAPRDGVGGPGRGELAGLSEGGGDLPLGEARTIGCSHTSHLDVRWGSTG